MSFYSAMLTGVSALDAYSKALTVSSSNIANVNTTGYKAETSDFSTFLAGNSSLGDVSAGGVQVSAQQNVSSQGLLTATSSPTDLAISGSGFFVVGADPTSSTNLYTRSGSFTTDADGNLVNSSGYYLKGWALDANGNVPANQSDLQVVNLKNISETASPTTSMNVQANLQSSTAIDSTYTTGAVAAGTDTADFEQTFNVFDSQGGTQPMQLAFVKTAANTWDYELSYAGSASNVTGLTNNVVKTGTLTFNADGTLASPASGTITATIPWAATTGLSSQPITLNFGTVGKTDGMSQFSSTSTLVSAGANGAPAGALSSVSVDSSGNVIAQFDNGVQQKVFKLPIATFTSLDGLASVSGNAYQASDASGTPTILEATTGGSGSIASSSLESSTVDLATEFTNLITAQRAYSAATKIVTTADEMMQELIQIKQ